MKFSFHELAEIELISAIEYYESCQAGLGFCFSEEVYATIERMFQFPLAWGRLIPKHGVALPVASLTEFFIASQKMK